MKKGIFVMVLALMAAVGCKKDSENIAPASFFGVWRYDGQIQKVYDFKTNKLIKTNTWKEDTYSIEFLKDSTLREVSLNGKISLQKVGIDYPNIYLSHLDSFGHCKVVSLTSDKMDLEIKGWYEKGLEYEITTLFLSK